MKKIVSEIEENKAFDIAFRFVTQTNQNLFITGRAGTGKTTFLKKIVSQSTKQMAVAAPTGVAAINAGGVTLHSLFWLPFGGYAEKHEVSWGQTQQLINNRSTLFGALRLTRQRRKLLQKLELLIIDEISMVRSDTLDAIDTILKSVRKDQRPFGGLQLVMIGDLLQLPPVVKANEWQILQEYYESPYFFDAKVLKEHPAITIEFEKIYRQQDDDFIQILNAIRTQKVEDYQLQQLNEKYQPDFQPLEDEGFITLTSHNSLAHSINKQALENLKGDFIHLQAEVSKDFPESLFPVEERLTLKKGAQVMFIKNDTGEERRFFNGKIGVVKEVGKDFVVVSFPSGEEEDVKVKKEIWENTKYKFDEKKETIDSEVIGTYRQYPLRLAWAITIHKSQGLTFEKAIVDAGRSFASGQVYVALSRLTSMEGLVLKSKIDRSSIYLDARVTRYLSHSSQSDTLEQKLLYAQKQHLQNILLHIFKWETIQDRFEEVKNILTESKIASKGEALSFLYNEEHKIQSISKVAYKFITTLQRLFFRKEETDYHFIAGRVQSAAKWFTEEVEKMIPEWRGHHSDFRIKKGSKKYGESFLLLVEELEKKNKSYQYSIEISRSLNNEEVTWQDVKTYLQEDHQPESTQESVSNKKISSKEISLSLFKQGQSIKEIAAQRELTENTIFNHLISFLDEDVDLSALVPSEKIDVIKEAILKHPGKGLKDLKSLLGSSVSYSDIRAVSTWVRKSEVV